MDKLIEILKVEGNRIAEEFRLASGQGQGTPQEVADFREHAVQDFVGRFLPQSHIVSKGKITDLDGNQSDSIDCLILNPAHPHLVDSKGKFRIVFADGCDAAIEVKPDLARSDELNRAQIQCRSVKRLRRSQTAILNTKKHPEYILEHSRRIPFFVFAQRAFDAPDLWKALVGYYTENAVPLVEQIDALIVNGAGVIKNIKFPELNPYGGAEAGQVGWFFEYWSDGSPIGMLVALESSYRSVPDISSSIMSRVLGKLGPIAVVRLGDHHAAPNSAAQPDANAQHHAS
jgi:hypothetical protein